MPISEELAAHQVTREEAVPTRADTATANGLTGLKVPEHLGDELDRQLHGGVDARIQVPPEVFFFLEMQYLRKMQ